MFFLRSVFTSDFVFTIFFCRSATDTGSFTTMTGTDCDWAIDRIHFGRSAASRKPYEDSNTSCTSWCGQTHRWRCRCHPAARPSSGQATLLIGTLLPASPSSARRERWEITVEACKLYAPNLPETTMIRAIPILTDLFRSWGPVEEGGREEITYDLTNLTWQVGT